VIRPGDGTQNKNGTLGPITLHACILSVCVSSSSTLLNFLPNSRDWLVFYHCCVCLFFPQTQQRVCTAFSPSRGCRGSEAASMGHLRAIRAKNFSLDFCDRLWYNMLLNDSKGGGCHVGDLESHLRNSDDCFSVLDVLLSNNSQMGR
jgi:hypothetical protein